MVHGAVPGATARWHFATPPRRFQMMLTEIPLNFFPPLDPIGLRLTKQIEQLTAAECERLEAGCDNDLMAAIEWQNEIIEQYSIHLKCALSIAANRFGRAAYTVERGWRFAFLISCACGLFFLAFCEQLTSDSTWPSPVPTVEAAGNYADDLQSIGVGTDKIPVISDFTFVKEKHENAGG